MIDDVKGLVDFYVRKNRYSGRLSGSQFDLLAKSAQIEIINENVRVDGLQKVLHLNDEIASLKTSSGAISKLGSSFIRPADYMYLIELSHNDGSTQRSIEILEDHKYNNRVNSDVAPPTTEFAIGKYLSSSFQVEPSSISEVYIEYVKQPDDPNWAYTISSGREVYNSGSSTDFAIPEIFINELAMRILAKLGISVREGEISQTATALRNE